MSPKELQTIFDRLLNEYKDPKTELTYDGPFQLLVAVILSAQCTDARVNQTTPALFKKYPTAEKLSHADLKDIEKLIHSCGFYRNKAKAIVGAARSIVERFGGQVPSSLDQLITLDGVGRKTASVVLNQAFDEPAIAVDTHVGRVSNRLGWVKSDDPVKIEFALRELIPRKWWAQVNGLLILHGRRTCKARKPLCDSCMIREFCASAPA